MRQDTLYMIPNDDDGWKGSVRALGCDGPLPLPVKVHISSALQLIPDY